MTNDEVLYQARECGVKFVRLQFTDLFGQLKNVAVMIDRLSKALEGEYMFDGSSIDGFARIEESDMYLRPDPDTFAIFPWRPQAGRVARLICDVYRPDGTPFEGDPRLILKNAAAKAEKLGYRMMVGPECEFFLFHTDNQGKPTTETQDEGGYFDLGPVDLGEDARRDICMALEDLGFNIEASHHEVAPGQHEIDFSHSYALRAADDIMTFRLTVKAIAKRHGLAATFMPKPLEGVCGNGLHMNLSLWKDGVNCFAGSAPGKLSPEAHSFAAGVMEHIGAITAFANPIVNSYKRLVPGYEAPVYTTWASHNQGALIRVPETHDDNTQLELRSPDPACNPYLAYAAILSAGMDGIVRGLKPPAMVETGVGGMSDEQRKVLGIRSLPRSLEEALNALEADSLILEAIGSHAAVNYIRTKRLEWEEYCSKVHPWEIERYLARY